MKKDKKKINKFKVIIFILIVFLFFTITVFGRYIYNNIRDRYLASKSFYFTSNLLTTNSKEEYRYSNWGGSGDTEIPIELYSYDNELLRMEYDLSYNITCEVIKGKDKGITCFVDQKGFTAQDGIIAVENGNKSVHRIIVVPPTSGLDIDDQVSIKVTATTDDVYSKTISATFTFVITAQEAEYEIEDVAGDSSLTLLLRNATASGSDITLEFDPKVIRLDMNDEIYVTNESIETETISEEMTVNGETFTNTAKFVKKITFKLNAESSRNIIFYKMDPKQDYTYPNGHTESVIKCTRTQS